MKTKTIAILAFLFALIGAPMVYANHVKAPNLPEASKFEGPYESSTQRPCGTLESYFYEVPDGSFWGKHFIKGHANPFMIIFRQGEPRKVWVDDNQDGHIDSYEEYADDDAFYSKYPSPCEAVR